MRKTLRAILCRKRGSILDGSLLIADLEGTCPLQEDLIMLRHNILPLTVGTRVAQVHPDYPAGGRHGILRMSQSSCDRLAARTAVAKLYEAAKRSAICLCVPLRQASVKTTCQHQPLKAWCGDESSTKPLSLMHASNIPYRLPWQRKLCQPQSTLHTSTHPNFHAVEIKVTPWSMLTASPSLAARAT